MGRILLGIGESLLLTGNLTWAMGVTGREWAGRVISWNGMATYGALAVGAPLGMMIYNNYGIVIAGLIMLLLPGCAKLFVLRIPESNIVAGQSVSLKQLIPLIWQLGVGLLLQGIGFAVLSTFTVLLFKEQQWQLSGFALTAFGFSFIAARLFCGHLLDKGDCIRVARISLLVEFSGLLLIAVAWHPSVALLGAALTGLGCSLIFPSLGVYLVHQVDTSSRGTALGGFSAFQDVAYGAAGPILGLMAPHAGYRAVFLVAACCALSGVIILRLLLQMKKNH